ncbi:MAG: hypothetical protein SFX18_19935 [Pirellulales bacterium]|nr:hypothetical protein [Pirellulales bacterium]
MDWREQFPERSFAEFAQVHFWLNHSNVAFLQALFIKPSSHRHLPEYAQVQEYYQSQGDNTFREIDDELESEPLFPRLERLKSGIASLAGKLRQSRNLPHFQTACLDMRAASQQPIMLGGQTFATAHQAVSQVASAILTAWNEHVSAKEAELQSSAMAAERCLEGMRKSLLPYREMPNYAGILQIERAASAGRDAGEKGTTMERNGTPALRQFLDFLKAEIDRIGAWIKEPATESKPDHYAAFGGMDQGEFQRLCGAAVSELDLRGLMREWGNEWKTLLAEFDTLRNVILDDKRRVTLRLDWPLLRCDFEQAWGGLNEIAGHSPSNPGLEANTPKPLDSDSSGTPKVAMLYGGSILKGKYVEIERIASDTSKSVDQKLWAIDRILKFPAKITMQTLADTFGVTRSAIGKTDWWMKNRAGKDDENQGRRIQVHKDKMRSPQNHRARNNPYVGGDDSDE